MQIDLVTLCLIGIFIVVGLMILSRMMGGRSSGGSSGGRPTDFGERGPESPTYDSPEVKSRGSFGRDQGDSTSSSNREVSSRRPGLNIPTFRGSRRTESGRVDNPEVKSRGSFGRPKNK